MALTINHLGMSLMRMGKTSETVRFLDEVDLTLSLDSRASSAQQRTSIEVATNPIVFRASYRDINMITAIINKAISLHGSTQKSDPAVDVGGSAPKSITSQNSPGTAEVSTKPLQQRTVGKARVLMSKEQVSFV